MTVTPADRVAAHSAVIGRDVAGETVLLDLHSGVYYGLDAVGTRMWNLLMERRTLDDVCGVMAGEYDVAPDVLRRDLIDLLRDLVERGLVVRETVES
jgi:hypothetical protein